MTYLIWLEKNYNNLRVLARRIDPKDGEEILHFTLDKFLTKDLKFFDDMEDNDKLKYMSRTIKLQSTSTSSQFYREFKRFTILSKDIIIEQEEEPDTDNNIEEIQLLFIQEELKKINWFSSLLYTRYIDTGYSAQKLADQLLIPLSTVQYHLRKVKNHIRVEWNKNKDRLI